MDSIDSAVDAIKLGAAEYLQKPLELSRVKALMSEVRAAVEGREAVVAAEGALAERLEFCGMIGRSPEMQELFTVIRRLAPYARTTLISGETGVGKELVARALHQLGPRREKRFATVNCSAVVETLFESELFGHVRGAFTGATDHKVGLFEAADGGTIFLDEVGELPMAVQSKLLRVLETGEVQRVGSVDTRRSDVRVVAATNRALEVEVAQGRFRSDSVLPSERRGTRRSTPAHEARGHSIPDGRIPASLRARVQEAHRRHLRLGRTSPPGGRMAGQHPGAPEHDRARVPAV